MNSPIERLVEISKEMVADNKYLMEMIRVALNGLACIVSGSDLFNAQREAMNTIEEMHKLSEHLTTAERKKNV